MILQKLKKRSQLKQFIKKNGEKIYTQRDKELAYYTIVHAKQVGGDKITCPNCGVETTREELLDGCDYCGTKFLIEDFDNRVAEFAFRPDYNVAYTKYKKRRDKVLLTMLLAVIGVIFIGTLIYVITHLDKMGLDAGFITTATSALIGTAIFSVAVIPIILVIYSWLIILLPAFAASLNLISKTILKKLKEAPQKDKSYVEMIQKYDPYFSISNFYTGLQNKIFTIIYADKKNQMQAFADKDLSHLLGRYDTVMDVETEYMGITDYRVDESVQQAEVEISINLLEYNGKKCSHRKENWTIKLEKSADCKTQVVCAPAIMTCKGCGASLDLLQGKTCSYCGNELDMKNYDWVIKDIEM